jgi:K+-sensing histidine kinase KdpD
MRDITDNLLFLSENTTLKDNEKVNFWEIIQTLETNINLDVKKDFIINGNKVLLTRLVTNLVENAKKYKISNSKIQISMDKSTFKISNKIKKSIVLEDTSILFDTFYKLDNSRNTLWFWLGLSIVKKICDLHNLKINIKITDWIFEVEIVN